MDIDHIQWHDSMIQRVVETPGADTVAFDVMYPIDWENNVFEPRTIVSMRYMATRSMRALFPAPQPFLMPLLQNLINSLSAA